MSLKGEAKVIEALRHGSPRERVRAASELASVGGLAAVAALREALESEDPLLRLTAGFALWRIERSRQGLDAVLEALSGSSPDAREGAVYALGAMGREIIPVIEELLARNPDREDLRRILVEIRSTPRRQLP